MQILEELDDVLSNDIVDRHSFFQLKHFVVGREITTQAKLWRCLREIRSRKSFIEQYIVEIDETGDRIALLEIDKLRLPSSHVDSLQGKEIEIKSRMLDRQIMGLHSHVTGLRDKVENYAEEARFYLAEFRMLEKVESLKPLDDVAAQREYWTAKLHHEINLSMLLHKPLDPEVINMILTLGEDSALRQLVLRMLDGNRRSIEAEAIAQTR